MAKEDVSKRLKDFVQKPIIDALIKKLREQKTAR